VRLKRWCADYKGEFLLGNQRYCDPLTISDFASRYLLLERGRSRYAVAAGGCRRLARRQFGLGDGRQCGQR
jgi:hypothetical protein